MNTTARHDDDSPSLPRTSAGVLAASIAAAAIAGLLTLTTPPTAQSLVPVSADNISAPPRDIALPLDDGVAWKRVERANEPDGASVAAYER